MNINIKLFITTFFLFFISLPNQCHGADESGSSSNRRRQQRISGTDSIRQTENPFSLIRDLGNMSIRQVEQQQATVTTSIRPTEQPTIRPEQRSSIRPEQSSIRQVGQQQPAANMSIHPEHGHHEIGRPGTSISAHGGDGQTAQQIGSIWTGISSSDSIHTQPSSSIRQASDSNRGAKRKRKKSGKKSIRQKEQQISSAREGIASSSKTETKMGKTAVNQIENMKMLALALKEENFKLKNAMEKKKEEKKYFGECFICKSPFKVDGISALTCGHTYHYGCIERWNIINHKCPTCKRTIEKIIPLFIDVDATEDEFAAMTRQIDGIDWIIYDWNAYKFNAANCSPNLTIKGEGLVLKNYGKEFETNSARANLPIPPFNPDTRKTTISFYYEVKNMDGNNLFIGFSDKHFSLEGKTFGLYKNTIGIWDKEGILIDGSFFDLGNGFEGFKKDDFVGIGIIHHETSKMESFSTCNGKLLGKVELPTKYAIIELFPVIDLYIPGQLVVVNFNKEEWKFKEFKQVLE